MSGHSGLIGRWRAQDIGGSPLRDDVASTIVFGSDGRVTGEAGVNRFGGPYHIEGDTIECPLHQARFHIPTGKALCEPAFGDLKTYPVQQKDGSIYIEV